MMDAFQLRTVVVQQSDFRIAEDFSVFSREDADAQRIVRVVELRETRAPVVSARPIRSGTTFLGTAQFLQRLRRVVITQLREFVP